MHMACNHTGWYAAAADKLLFQTVMAEAGLPTPELVAVTRRTGAGTTSQFLADTREAEAFASRTTTRSSPSRWMASTAWPS